MLISYNWLKSYIRELPDVDKLTELITFKLCEIESVEKLPSGDTVFDLKILPDRAHDLLSHRGVAYEIAGMLGIEVDTNSLHNSFAQVLGRGGREPVPDHSQKDNASEFEEIHTNLQIEIQSPACYRYMGRIVRGVKVSPSPVWMVKYLESIGQRSINNIVDATNIILFGIGQPIHAFDLRKLDSDKIIVKNAREGDELELVGSEKLKVKLKESDMMITDGIKNLAIAGVKGGLDSGISDNTTDILIEVANFDSVSVRKTARRLGVQTDASKRYENGLSPILCDLAMGEISLLIKEMCLGAKFEEVIDIYKVKPEERRVTFSGDYISKVLGIKIPDDEIEKILKNYNYEFSHESDLWNIVVPQLRLDITGPHDMVEEIGRIYGYDRITPELPNKNINAKDNDTWVKICSAKFHLINAGYKEVMTYVFVDKGEVEIMASASDKNFLRTNLTDGLNKSYELNRLNAPLLDMKEIKIFEIGTVFKKDHEEIHVAYRDKDSIIEMSLDEFIKDKILQDISQQTAPKGLFKSWSLYPFICRDIAVWIPEDTGKDILENIYKEMGGNLLIKDPILFDQFTKEGRVSYAHSLVFQSYEKTLTDDEIKIIIDKIYVRIKDMGWEVR